MNIEDRKKYSLADKLGVRGPEIHVSAKKENEAPADAVSGQYGVFESAAHNENLFRFHARQGQGFAAEQANDVVDKLHGRNATILGNDNAKNGADRFVDGSLIQTKYCQNAYASVNAAFDHGTGNYRYIAQNGQPMQLEVPSDQYDEAVRLMRKKILEGKVSGVTDPNDAKDLVRKGNVDYKTACHIAQAGNIDSLLFDAAHGTVIAANAFGISAVITFAHALWNGKSMDDAIDASMYVGLSMGSTVFLSSVLSAQLARTGLNQAIQQPVMEVVRRLPPSVRRTMLATLQNGAVAFGKGASGNLVKLASSNLISGAAFTLVMSASDIVHFFSGKTSGKQLFKNVMHVAGGMGGAAGGAAAGTAIAGPGVGSAIGALVGGILASSGTSKLLDHFIEDDAVAMVRILQDEIVALAQEYLLSQEELGLVCEDLDAVLSQGRLLDMYASDDHKQYADALLREVIEKIVRLRARIILPPNEEFLKGMARVIHMGQDPAKLQKHLNGAEVDTVALGEQLLHRKVSRHAADKAWYATKQMNLVNVQKEVLLMNMKNSERKHVQHEKAYHEEMKQLEADLSALMEETEHES